MVNVLATGVADYQHIREIDELIAERFKFIPLEKQLIYLIDTVDASALPFLADQFNVSGFKGWNQTSTDLEKRELIKTAIELHRYKGTPWAVRQAMKTIGFDDIDIIEHVGADYDGLFLYNGAQNHGGGNPFNFRIILNLPSGKTVSSNELDLIKIIIEEYKNVRSYLTDIQIKNIE